MTDKGHKKMLRPGTPNDTYCPIPEKKGSTPTSESRCQLHGRLSPVSTVPIRDGLSSGMRSRL